MDSYPFFIQHICTQKTTFVAAALLVKMQIPADRSLPGFALI